LKQHAFITVLMLSIIAEGLFVLWIANRTDLEMRNDLLRQTRLVAQAVNIQRVLALTGTQVDLNKPEYLRLKKQLGSIMEIDKRYRFIYLMGRKDDGRIFFFVDNEPLGSEDESPAGQIYKEASPKLRQVFDSGNELVEGPVPDQWARGSQLWSRSRIRRVMN